MAGSPFILRPSVAPLAPPGFPPDVAPNQIIYAAHINAIRDSVAIWPGNIDGNSKTLSGVASIGSAIVETPKLQSVADLAFHVGAGYPERVRILASTGNVGMGTNNPQALLDLYTTVINADMLIIRCGVASNADGPGIVLAQNSLSAAQAKVRGYFNSGINTMGISITGFNGIAQVQQFLFDGSGRFAAMNLPSTNPGGGTKQFWYDPADGNRVKYAA